MSVMPKSLVVFFGGAADSYHMSMFKVYVNYTAECEIKREYPKTITRYYSWTCQPMAIVSDPIVRNLMNLPALIVPNYKKVANEITKLYPNPHKHICIIGHSYGGDTAMKVASLCKCPIKLLVTLDPVSQIAHTEYEYPKPENVTVWINVYVPTSDISGVGGQWGSQNGAYKNIYIPKAVHGDADVMFKAIKGYVNRLTEIPFPKSQLIEKLKYELKNTGKHIQKLSQEPLGFGHGQSFMETINKAFENRLKDINKH